MGSPRVMPHRAMRSMPGCSVLDPDHTPGAMDRWRRHSRGSDSCSGCGSHDRRNQIDRPPLPSPHGSHTPWHRGDPWSQRCRSRTLCHPDPEIADLLWLVTELQKLLTAATCLHRTVRERVPHSQGMTSEIDASAGGILDTELRRVRLPKGY